MADKQTDDEVVQFSTEVLDFSSQYGSENSLSYTVANLSGHSTIYPRYGDFTQACVLRTYGPLWEEAPSKPKPFRRKSESFISQDFVDLWFETEVYPSKIEIFETYNPGAVVCIWAQNNQQSGVTWFRLWAGAPQVVPAGSRIFTPPLRPCPFKTSIIRLEFNHTHLDYYTELDAVRMYGTITSSNHKISNHILEEGSSVDGPLNQKFAQMVLQDVEDEGVAKDTSHGVEDDGAPRETQLDGHSSLVQTENGYFDAIPEEVIQLILSCLDIPSLCNAALTCNLLYKHCYDPLQYTEVDLQPYWNQVSCSALQGLQTRCRHLQRLCLSWCGSYDQIMTHHFNRFMQCCGSEITVLRLASCKFVTNDAIKVISQQCPALSELDLQCVKRVDHNGFLQLIRLSGLQRLNLYRTNIDVHSLVAILRSSPHLEHLNVGACMAVNNFDDVAIELATNCVKLKTLDVWRARSLSEVGLHAISKQCPHLEELDAGWCSDLRSGTGCFVELIERCPNLRKLFLTANRSVCDTDLAAIVKHGSHMEQLDILGTREVSSGQTLAVLEHCKRLSFLDISFCAGIDFATVHRWRQQFPQVNIKKSFQS